MQTAWSTAAAIALLSASLHAGTEGAAGESTE